MGFAVDWGWQRGLTVWLLAGRRSEPRFDHKLLEHALPTRPAGEREARTAARRWWRARDRAEALSAASARQLRTLAAGKPLTLTATRDLDLSQATVLAGLLRETT